MIHLLWSLLNLIIFLYFLYLALGLIVKGKRIFTPRFKGLSILVLVIGLARIILGPTVDMKDNLVSLTNDYDKNKNMEVKKILLEDNLTFDINMLVAYSVDQDKWIPVEASSSLSGFVNGYSWQLITARADIHKPNEETTYTAIGVLNWKLFGIPIYGESKIFNGTIK